MVDARGDRCSCNPGEERHSSLGPRLNCGHDGSHHSWKAELNTSIRFTGQIYFVLRLRMGSLTGGFNVHFLTTTAEIGPKND